MIVGKRIAMGASALAMTQEKRKSNSAVKITALYFTLKQSFVANSNRVRQLFLRTL